MLDDLNRRQAADAAVRLTLEIPERVALLDIEPARAAQLHHAVVGVDAAGADAVLARSSSSSSPRPQPTSTTSAADETSGT